MKEELRIDIVGLAGACSYALDCIEAELVKIKNKHGKRVAYISVCMAEYLAIQGDALQDLAMCALLHDNALTQYITEELERNYVIDIKKDLSVRKTNLHCIRDMNPSYVKMDRDFTAKAMNSDRDYELYKNIIPMVHCINVRICAEGIEERDWYLKMKEMQVDYLQGYYFGRPCGKEQFLQQYASGINVK